MWKSNAKISGNRKKFYISALIGCSPIESVSCDSKENIVYFIQETDMDKSAPETTIFPVIWDRYYIQTEMEIQEDFRAYIARYRNLDKMQVKIFDFRSGRLVYTLDVKDTLTPYLEDYQPADQKLDAICYEEKDCLCIFLEERRLWKKSSEQLPVTVFLLDIQSGEIVAELREDSWMDEDASEEETGNEGSFGTKFEEYPLLV